ncbi:hypothetical protein ACFVU3_11530 [Streptomyces sp. NPDC058052]|uniref:hypothetical protein n=1 Tax=Streptomyces sp. NPDC058052 TaxID=3346316 RepID=UPI0036E08EDA
MTADSTRFRDPRSAKHEYLDSIIVRCPGCARAARVVPAPGVDLGPDIPKMFLPRHLVCRACGFSRRWNGCHVLFSGGTAGPATDPYFGVPLWLQTDTRHGRLWAYDLAHLDLIRRYVQAPLRERAPWYETGRKMTLVARLPAWIKRAKNRDEILRAVRRLHASLADA